MPRLVPERGRSNIIDDEGASSTYVWLRTKEIMVEETGQGKVDISHLVVDVTTTKT